MKRKLIILGLAAIMSVFSLAGCGSKDAAENPADTGAKTAESADSSNTSEDDGKVYTPTFMYFVSGADEKYDDEMALVEELKAEYGDKVKFDIHNIDETPEDKDNFPVENMTPALIMLNTGNDISGMQFMCSDKDTLKSEIDKALNGEN